MICACGHGVGDGLLACPRCQRLVHAEQLKTLAAAAEQHQSGGRLTEALASYREALALLPPGTRQFEAIRARIAGLSKQLDAVPKKAGFGPFAGVVGGAALLLWKLKSLLFGLTKASTLFTMFLAFGAYWTLFGWRFALGFVLGIYVHEMGHVVALSRRGIGASAPMFVPGLGAFVRGKHYPIDARESARVALAGPVWGAAAAIAFWLLSLRFGELFVGLARATAWLNLFNLLPFAGLDGDKGMAALDRTERWIVAGALAAMFAITGEGMLLVVALGALYRATQAAPDEGDRRACIEFVTLITVLGALCLLPMPSTR